MTSTKLPPKSVGFYQTHFTREWRARCDTCGTVWAVWDNADLQAHAETCTSTYVASVPVAE